MRRRQELPALPVHAIRPMMSHAANTVVAVGACPGSLIVHRDGTVAGCTNDDDEDGCRGRDPRHEGDPTVCVDWWGGCNTAASTSRSPATRHSCRSRGAHAFVRKARVVEIGVIVSGPHQARSTEACARLTGLLGRYVGGIGVLDCPLTTTSCLPHLPSRRRASPTRGGRRRGYAHDEKCDLVDHASQLRACLLARCGRGAPGGGIVLRTRSF